MVGVGRPSVWPIYINVASKCATKLYRVQPQNYTCSEMQTTRCVGLAFLPAKGSHHHKAAGASAAAPPVLIGGSVKLVLLSRQLVCFSWSRHRVRTWASAAAASSATTPRQELLEEEEGNQIISRNVSNFEPSVWGDFFLTYSSPLASSTQQVCFFSLFGSNRSMFLANCLEHQQCIMS